MATGTCKLTGEHGKFVRSHLLPQALTRPEGPGAPLIQAGMSARPIRRWTSWYDPRLVTSAGEAILSKHDDSGIKELQRHKLVWSSWGPMVKLESQGFREYRYDDHSMGVRHLTDVDTLTLRMFFLSLLWRAAATDLVEFAEVHLNKEQLSQLTEMILSNNPEPLDFYPIELIQLSTIGIVTITPRSKP